MSLLKQLITTSPPTGTAGNITDAFRKSHDIKGSTGGAQTDYLKKVIANFNLSRNLEAAEYEELGSPVVTTGDSSRPGITSIADLVIMRDPETMEAVLWGGKYWAICMTRAGGWTTTNCDVYSSADLLSWTEEYKDIIAEVGATWEQQIYLVSSFTYHEGDAEPFLIFYCARDGNLTTDRLRVGGARSDDMQNWTKNVNNPLFEYQNATWAVYGTERLAIAKMSAGAAHKWIAVFEGDSVTPDVRHNIGIAYNDDEDPDTTGLTYSNQPFSSNAAGIDRETDPTVFRVGSRYYIFYEIFPTGESALPTGGMWAEEDDVFTVDTGWTRFLNNPVLGSMTGADHKCGGLHGVLLNDKLYLPYGGPPAFGATLAIADLTNQVSLEGECNSDFGGVRFTEDDGTTELVYWLKEKVDDYYAIFWVEIPDIPASPNEETIYIYYGKAGETTTSTDLREDFTGYTEVGNGNLAYTAHHIDATLTRNEETYLYEDKGAGHFTNFVHYVAVKITHDTDKSIVFAWCLSNDLDDVKGLLDNNKTSVEIECFDIDGLTVHRLHLWETFGGALNLSGVYDLIANGVFYYLKFKKSGTALEVRIFSDADGTDLLATLSITLNADHSFQFIFGANAYNTGNAWQANVDIEDMFLRKYVDPEPTHEAWGAEEEVVWPF